MPVPLPTQLPFIFPAYALKGYHTPSRKLDQNSRYTSHSIASNAERGIFIATQKNPKTNPNNPKEDQTETPFS